MRAPPPLPSLQCHYRPPAYLLPGAMIGNANGLAFDQTVSSMQFQKSSYPFGMDLRPRTSALPPDSFPTFQVSLQASPCPIQDSQILTSDATVSSQLPYMVVVTPHLDVPSEFWYAGSHYQDGWDFLAPTTDSWYNHIHFSC